MSVEEKRVSKTREFLTISASIVFLSFLGTYFLAFIVVGVPGILFGWKFSSYLLFPALIGIVSVAVFKLIVSDATFKRWIPAVPAISMLLLAVLEMTYLYGDNPWTPVAAVFVGLGFRSLKSALEKWKIARVLVVAFILVNVTLSLALSGPQYFDFLYR